jgi:predicted hotdog family 3-hydroxylacyl-ACP dehydratase
VNLYDNMEAILPHRSPMVLLDRVLSADDEKARATRTFASGAYGTEGALVSEPAIIEALAQTVAALQGIRAARMGLKPGPGMLVGISDFAFHDEARIGMPVELSVTVTRRLPPFCLADTQATQNGRIIAEGTMKFFLEEGTK